MAQSYREGPNSDPPRLCPNECTHNVSFIRQFRLVEVPVTEDLNKTGPRRLPEAMENRRLVKLFEFERLWDARTLVTAEGIHLFGSFQEKCIDGDTKIVGFRASQQNLVTCGLRVNIDGAYDIPFQRKFNTIYHMSRTNEFLAIPGPYILQDREKNYGHPSIRARKDTYRKGGTRDNRYFIPLQLWDLIPHWISLCFLSLAAGSSAENPDRVPGEQRVACPFCMQMFGPPYYKIGTNQDWFTSSGSFSEMWEHIRQAGHNEDPERCGRTLHPPENFIEMLQNQPPFPDGLLIFPEVFEDDESMVLPEPPIRKAPTGKGSSVSSS